jgi:hypothetical protein
MRLRRLLAMVFLPHLAFASLFEVHPQESIQSAVYAAFDGDTILIHEGVYIETVILYGKTLTIGSQFLLDGDTSHIAQTSVVANSIRPDTGSAFVYGYGETIESHLTGLTLSGHGTVWWQSGALSGGALFVSMSELTLEHCRLVNSTAVCGGGMLLTGNWAWTTSKAAIQDCQFIGCHALNTGGGLYARDCSLRVERCEFVKDTADAGCSGLRITRSYATVNACTLRGCFGPHGAMWYGRNEGNVSDCLFEGNGGEPLNTTSDLILDNNDAYVAHCIFRNNATGHSPISLNQSVLPLRFYGNVIENMVVTHLTGTVLMNDNSFGEFGYNIISNNQNVSGGAIYCSHSRARIHHNAIVNNVSLNSERPSVLTSVTNARPTMDSNLIVGNTGPTVDYAMGYHVILDARNNWWGDLSGPYHPTLNPFGQGDTILSDSVLFIPWLTSPPDTTMPSSLDRRSTQVVSTWRLLAVYPNPFNSEMRLVIAGFARDDFRLTLHNLLGQQVDVIHSGALTGGELHYRANPSLASGVYFVRASAKDGVQTEKIIFLK